MNWHMIQNYVNGNAAGLIISWEIVVVYVAYKLGRWRWKR